MKENHVVDLSQINWDTLEIDEPVLDYRYLENGEMQVSMTMRRDVYIADFDGNFVKIGESMKHRRAEP